MKSLLWSRTFRILIAILSLALVASLCGAPDGSDEAEAPEEEAQVEEEDVEEEEPAVEEEEVEAEELEAEESDAGAVEKAGSGVVPSGGDPSVPMPSGLEVTIAFVNKSELDICRIWVTPTAADSWGEAVELPSPLPDGSTHNVTGLPAGFYDIKVEDCAGNVLAWNQGIDVQESAIPIEADVDVPVAVASFRNDLQDDICAVYMTRVEDFADKGWRRNLISETNMFVPNQIRYLKAGEGNWNFRVETCGGDVYEGSNLPLTTGDNIFDISTLEW
jgi:hypothetical protein